MPDTIPAPFCDRPWRSDGVSPSPEALAVPTMLSDEEGRLLHWLTRDYGTGAGAIVDLGCFLGGSTARLASGADAAGRRATIHAFDHFTIQENLKEKYLYPAGIARFDGENMLPIAKHFLRPWQEMVTLVPGDIRHAEWRGEPIEILFIDAGKTPESTDRIAMLFMPHLIPGHSVVVQQDYQHWRQPWIAAQMEQLSPAFELAGWCEKSTVIWRCTRRVTPEILAAGCVAALDDAAMIDTLYSAAQRFPNDKPRRQIARAVMAVEDNPGVRLPYQMRNDAFSNARVRAFLRSA
ncbi:MAG: class I SAM-dependent methyltransferase [Pseudomonadota bacterium]